MPQLLLALLALICLAAPGQAGNRIGLVIGNNAYAEVPALDKAVSDALAVSHVLGGQGFEILTATDLSRRGMNRRISEFTGRLQPGDTAFVFFAGHGVEIDGENYLLPTDIAVPGAGERDFIKSESIALSDLLDRVRATGARAAVVIIDACRNNPFEITTGRSIGRTRGLGRITAPQGSFVIFSAGAGQLALDELTEDDAATNSVFTRALLPRLSQPGLELRELMAGLRVDVRNLARQVNHVQVPAYYDELIGEFYFSPPSDSTDADPPRTAKPPAAPAGSPDPMRADFDLARSVGTAAAMRAFLDRYADRKDSLSHQLAAQILQDLEGEAAPAPDPRRADPAPRSRRDILRETQRALNARGCNAGVADGIIGARTRRAFAAFLAATDSGLRPDALGSEAALDAVLATEGRICHPPAAPTTAAAPVTGTQPTDESAPAPALTLTGTWRFSASCALFIKSTGTIRFTPTGPNTWRTAITDNLGNVGQGEARLDGRSISSTERFPTLVNHFRGTLSSDGNSYSGSGTNTCAVTARRN